MKYAGTINVIDDEGNIVYERELSQEAIIAELLMSARIEAPAAYPPVTVVVAPPSVPRSGGKGQKVCKVCGVPGHMQKTCPKQRIADRDAAPDPVAIKAQTAFAAPTPPPRSHEVRNMSPMSKRNFEVLKEMQMEDQEPEQISAEIGWEDMDDIAIALRSNSYMIYMFERKKMRKI